MDVFERVREVNEGAELTAEQILDARTRLFVGIDEAATAGRKRFGRRPMILIAGGVVGVAVVAVAAIVVGQLTATAPTVEVAPAPTSSPLPSSSAVPPIPSPTVTTGAGAVETETFPGTTPQPGQYLKMTSTAQLLRYRGPDSELPYQWLFRDNFTTQPPISALLVQNDSATFVPADRSEEWVRVDGSRNQRIRSYSELQTPDDRSVWDAMLPADPEDHVVRGPGEDFVGGYLVNRDYSVYPRDPQALLDYLREYFAPAGSNRDDSVMVLILTLLRSNLAPPEVRKAFIDALKLSGLATIESAAGTVTTYGVDLTTVDPHRETISIDAKTGWATGYTETATRSDGGLVPASVPDLRVTLTVMIVDTAP
jgi:hypothetical protein